MVDHSWSANRTIGLAAVAAAVIVTVLSPPLGIAVDVVVAGWAHHVGARFARNGLLVLAAADAVWIALGVGHGTTGLHPLS